MSASCDRILTAMEDRQLAELTRNYGQQYEITQAEDGRVILTPKLTAQARRARLGGRDLTDEEFEQLFGHLPTGPA